MLTIECPACGFGFMHRRARECPRCGVHLLMSGERWVIDGKRTFLFTSKGWLEWVEPSSFAGTG